MPLVIIIALLCLLLALSPTLAQPTDAAVQALLAKSAAYGLGKYPIGFWSYTNLNQHAQYMDEAEVQEWADAGFTVPQTPSFDPAKPEQVAHMHKLLDWAQARGMKLIVCDPRCNAKWVNKDDKLVVPDGYAAGVQAAVTEFGDHPALFGFHVGDEPDAAMKEAFFECYRTQKEVAPKLHPFANLLPYFDGMEKRAGSDTWPNYLDEYCKDSNADLICYDCYCQMWTGDRGWNDYFRNLRLYREAAWRNGTPYWNTALSVGHFAYRCPTYDDFRWQLNTTVASGAHGLLWFFYYMREPHCNYRLAPIDEHFERTEGYDNLRRIQKTFHRLYGDLFTRLVCTKVMFCGKVYGGGEKLSPDELVAKVTPEDAPALLSEFVDAQGRRYLMLVNLDLAESRQVGLAFAPGRRYFSWNWSGKEYEGAAYAHCGTSKDAEGNTVVTHFLAPGQEAVYRVQ